MARSASRIVQGCLRLAVHASLLIDVVIDPRSALDRPDGRRRWRSRPWNEDPICAGYSRCASAPSVGKGTAGPRSAGWSDPDRPARRSEVRSAVRLPHPVVGRRRDPDTPSPGGARAAALVIRCSTVRAPNGPATREGPLGPGAAEIAITAGRGGDRSLLPRIQLGHDVAGPLIGERRLRGEIGVVRTRWPGPAESPRPGPAPVGGHLAEVGDNPAKQIVGTGQFGDPGHVGSGEQCPQQMAGPQRIAPDLLRRERAAPSRSPRASAS